MGTRAVFTFKDNYNSEEFHVYTHWDGYPEYAALQLVRALDKAWPLPRFEADEFACSFIGANKSGEGNFRLTKHWEEHGDISYRYEIWQAANKQLIVRAFNPNMEIFYGRMKDFVKKYGNLEAREKWDEHVPSDNKLAA